MNEILTPKDVQSFRRAGDTATFLASVEANKLGRTVMALCDSHEALRAERDALRDAARGVMTSCRECADERDFYVDPVAPAEFIIWGKLAPPEALGPKCREHAVKHLGHHVATRTDQYAVVDLRPLRTLLAEGPDTRPDPAQAVELPGSVKPGDLLIYGCQTIVVPEPPSEDAIAVHNAAADAIEEMVRRPESTPEEGT